MLRKAALILIKKVVKFQTIQIVIYSCDEGNFQQPFLQSSVSHNPSEITVLLNMFNETVLHLVQDSSKFKRTEFTCDGNPF